MIYLSTVQIEKENSRSSILLPTVTTGEAGNGALLALDPPLVQPDGCDGKHVIDRAILATSWTCDRDVLDVVMVVQEAVAQVTDDALDCPPGSVLLLLLLQSHND